MNIIIIQENDEPWREHIDEEIAKDGGISPDRN